MSTEILVIPKPASFDLRHKTKQLTTGDNDANPTYALFPPSMTCPSRTSTGRGSSASP